MADGVDIRMPKLNNNDDSYVLVEWLIGDAQPVTADDYIATVETSKAAEDLPSSGAGVLRHVVAAGTECKPGDLIARVLPEGAPLDLGAARGQAVAEENGGGPLITAPAQDLLAELGIDPELARGLGVKIVRKGDVERLAASLATDTEAAPNTVTLPAGQQAVARTVTQSHQSIPAAYTVIRVDVTEVVTRARELAAQWRALVGVPEFLIAAVAGLREQFPLCFGRLVDEGTVALADGSHVGVTIDIGRGLFVPVVRDADTMDLREIAKAVGALRNKAIRNAFREQDLSGGAISVTLHTDPDVTVAVPVVFPGQVCALALGGTRAEVVPDGDAVRVAQIVHIGLSYDHRVINGRDAARFLRAVKESIEERGRLP